MLSVDVHYFFLNFRQPTLSKKFKKKKILTCHHNTSKVVVDDKLSRPFRTNLLIEISKLVS